MSTHDESTRRDQGSALIMAIVFVTVIGVAMAAGLGYAAATIRAQSTTYEPMRDNLYAADAAVKATVKYIVANPAAGQSGSGCKTAMTYGTVNGVDVTTQVCPQGSTSLLTNAAVTSWGLLTLAVGSEDGLSVSGQGGLQVNGSVQANSKVDVGSGSNLAVVGGTIEAKGGCSGTITMNGAAISGCTVGTLPAVDPGLVAGVAGRPTVVGTGTCTGNIATLEPGFWTPSTINDAIGGCGYVQLKPGVHYIEGTESSSNKNLWTIKSKVVAGQLAGDITTTAAGSSCVQGSNGVTVVLGGEARIALSGSTATLEICGRAVTQTDGKSLEVPLYGAPADIFTTQTYTLATTTDPTGTGWSTPANAKTVNGVSSTISVPKNTSATNPLNITGFTGTAIPSDVTALKAEVTGMSTSSATFAISIRNSSGNSVCTSSSGNAFPTGSLGKVTVNLTCSGGSLPLPLTARITATTPNNGTTRTVSVDGVVLSYVAAGPKILAQSGCVAAVSGCAALATSGNTNNIFLDGVVYLPKAKVDVQIPNVSTSFSTLGVVVRVFSVQTTSSTSSLPIVATENGSLNPGDVTVLAKVGPDAWMTCRVSISAAGAKVTGSTIQGCTVPR